MRYLIAYDICDPKRLRKAARLIERYSLRCQKSVYLFEGTEETLTDLLTQGAALLDPGADILQAWKLRADQPLLGEVRGTARLLNPTFAVL
jgi:CRISPR-associated protein Cas2